MGGVEREQVLYAVDVADGHQASIMYLLSDNAKRFHNRFPRISCLTT